MTREVLKMKHIDCAHNVVSTWVDTHTYIHNILFAESTIFLIRLECFANATGYV